MTVNKTSNYKEETTDMMRAAFWGQTDAVRLLLERGADPNGSDATGTTALMVAAMNGHTGTVGLLLEHGADVNARDDDGGTALELADRNGKVDVADLMLEHGADASTRDEETAMLEAARHANVKAAHLLRTARSSCS